MKLKIKEAAQELGVSDKTLRRWEQSQKIIVERTKGGHRRYDLAQLRGLAPGTISSEERSTLAYARVSSHDQKEDLIRQITLLESFCSKNGWKFEILEDIGSGLNYQKRGLQKLIKKICCGEIRRLVLSHKDRLLRFGAELIFALCEQFGTEVVIINASENSSFEEELVQDVLEIITVFSARLYGSRSHKNKQIIKRLQETANEIGSQSKVETK